MKQKALRAGDAHSHEDEECRIGDEGNEKRKEMEKN